MIRLGARLLLQSALLITLWFPRAALADEGGVSFWVPGFFGSLAATPQHPGFSWATTLGPIPFTVSGGRIDSVTAFGNVAPQFALRWNGAFTTVPPWANHS